MSLNWDATEVKDFENIDPSLMHAMVFMTIGVGIGHITEANAEEFYARASFSEKVLGASRFGTDSETGVTEPVFITPDEVRSCIGLRTNVSPISTAKFKGNVYDSHKRWNVRF